MAYPTIQYAGEKLMLTLVHMNDHLYLGIPMLCSGFKTCDALRANNYFSGPQFGTAGAWVI